VADWFTPYENGKWRVLSFRPFSWVYIAWCAAYMWCQAFIMITHLATKINNGLFYHLCHRLLLWFCFFISYQTGFRYWDYIVSNDRMID
jgi:hypothetical protein